MPNIKQKQCGFIAIVGAPNAGKSTLLNKVTNQKVSIVTPKAQTTRNRIRGIRVLNNSQMIFVDTPGIFKVEGKLDNRLNRSIVKTAKNSLEGIDFIVFVFDSKKDITENDIEVINFIKLKKNPKILLLNKIDLIDKERLLKLTTELNKLLSFDQTFMVSAEKGDGVDDFLKFISEKMPVGEFLFPEDEITDFPARMLAAEVTREKIFLFLRKEIPYNTMVETETYKEDRNKIVIHQSIYSISEAHKRILIGAKGAMLKKIGEQSRRELTKLLGKNTQLFIHIKVREDWAQSKKSYINSGIDFEN